MIVKMTTVSGEEGGQMDESDDRRDGNHRKEKLR